MYICMYVHIYIYIYCLPLLRVVAVRRDVAPTRERQHPRADLFVYYYFSFTFFLFGGNPTATQHPRADLNNNSYSPYSTPL